MGARATYNITALVLALCLALGVALFVGSHRPRAASAAQAWPPDRTPTLADTSYPVSPGAYLVAPDGDDTGPGTAAAPWRTLGHAVNAVPPGATIVIRSGVYREELTIRDKTLTLQPFPHEQVWMRGSLEVTGWQRAGSAWRHDGWTHRLPRREGIGAEGYELAGYAEMVFLDGAPLRQVGSRKDLRPDAFFIDRSGGSIYLGADPADRTVEVSAFEHAIRLINAPGTIVRGLGFAHYASPAQNGSLRADERSRGLRIEANTFAWNAAAGLSLLAADCVVRNNLLAYNGQLGLHAFRAHRLLLEGNRIVANNQERFDTSWEAGGVKVSEAEETTWRDNLVLDNLGNGLWCDIDCSRTTIVRNLVRGNQGNGIFYEISAGAIIASNLLLDNTRSGIYILEAATVAVYNNTLVNNRQQIRVFEHSREQKVRDVTIFNNILAGGPRAEWALLGVDDSAKRGDAEQMGVRADYNLYRPTGAGDELTFWLVEGRRQSYADLDAFSAASGQEPHGLQPDVGLDELFENPAGDDYRLRADSLARGGGAPLPAEIAAAIGVGTTTPSGLGVLRLPAQATLLERDTDET